MSQSSENTSQEQQSVDSSQSSSHSEHEQDSLAQSQSSLASQLSSSQEGAYGFSWLERNYIHSTPSSQGSQGSRQYDPLNPTLSDIFETASTSQSTLTSFGHVGSANQTLNDASQFIDDEAIEDDDDVEQEDETEEDTIVSDMNEESYGDDDDE